MFEARRLYGVAHGPLPSGGLVGSTSARYAMAARRTVERVIPIRAAVSLIPTSRTDW